MQKSGCHGDTLEMITSVELTPPLHVRNLDTLFAKSNSPSTDWPMRIFVLKENKYSHWPIS